MSQNIDKQVEQIKAAAAKQIAEIKTAGIRTALLDAARNPKVSEDDLYTAAKSFCNLVEKKRRADKNSK